jgi:formate hydrogenlyase subunit 3/multisubunit Na+/H+ antiporter MnhD subunit
MPVSASESALAPAHVPLLLISAIAIAAAALFFVALAKTPNVKPSVWPYMLIVGGLSVAGLAVSHPWLRIGLLELAALLTVFIVWATGRRKTAKITYLAAVLLSAGSLVASELSIDQSWSRALLLTSVFVKLAAVPMFFWLLALADEVPALVLGIIIAVVDMAAFGEFLIGAQTMPSLLTPQPLLPFVAAFTSLLAAMLMLTQRSLKRLLVLSTVEDVGFLLLGVASASKIGIEGAVIAASTHALAKALLFICLAAPEADGAFNSEPVALAVRYPVSAFGFLFGMLAMLGIPPTLGFIGRWRLYSAAFQIGFCPLTIFIASSILALIAYTLALTRNWWGPPREPSKEPREVAYEATFESEMGEPFALKAVIVVLVAVLLIAGIWPHAWQSLMGVRP